MPIEVDAFHDARTGTVTYLVTDHPSHTSAVIDCVLGFDAVSGHVDDDGLRAIVRRLDEIGGRLAWILETHIHADHLSGAATLRTQRGGRIAIGAGIVDVWRRWRNWYPRGVVAPDEAALLTDGAFDRLLAGGERIALGAEVIEVIDTPGHTPAGVSYRIADSVFVGDTLFMPAAGTARCDFPGGDAATLYRSIATLLALPGTTRVFTGHDYAHQQGEPACWLSSVDEQRAHNVHVGHGVSEATFIALRVARDRTLPPPALLWPALQVNLRGGQLQSQTARETTNQEVSVCPSPLGGEGSSDGLFDGRAGVEVRGP